MTPNVKALLACIVFALAGVVSALFFAPLSSLTVPHIIFYAVLTLNSYFSVRLFAAIQPQDTWQFIADAILVAVYLALALSIGNPVWFAFFALSVFIAAPPKYALMLGKIPYTRLLKKKIRIDLTGTAFCALILGATILGYQFQSAWALALIFLVANVYLLMIKPMYRLGERDA